MPKLAHRDLQTVIAFICGLNAAEGLEDYSRYLVRELRRLVPAERSSYNDIYLQRGRFRSISNGAAAAGVDPDRIMVGLIRQNPAFRYFEDHRDHQWRTISDFTTRQQFHRTAAYNEWYRLVETEFMAVTVFPALGGGVVGLALSRRSRDFTERERQILDVLPPHLLQSYRNASRATEMSQTFASMNRGVDASGVGIILLNQDHRSQLTTTRARAWLAEYFGLQPRHPDRLPSRVLDWVAQQDIKPSRADHMPLPRGALVTEADGKRLIVRLVSRQGEPVLLLREEYLEIPVPVLEALGLSRREAEVLKWAAEGKRDGEIALILGLSVRTVNHHLERIYRKLNVETRTTAAAHALEAAGRHMVSAAR